jgi:hypothetical protein
MIQISYGWCGVGAHEFKDFFDPDDLICNDFDSQDGAHGRIYNSQLYPIKGYLKQNTLLSYAYVAEDSFHWESILFVEDILKKEEGVKYPLCLDLQKNTPPEDCGGWLGYDDLILAMRSKKSDLYQNHIRVFGSPYDSSYFNINDVNDQLVNWRQFRRHWLSISNQLSDMSF